MRISKLNAKQRAKAKAGYDRAIDRIRKVQEAAKALKKTPLIPD